MLEDVLLATTGRDGSVSLVDVATSQVRDRVALPHASFIIEGRVKGTYYALHGDESSGSLTRLSVSDGRLLTHETVATVGVLPCHAAFTADGSLVVACYLDSRLAAFELADDGSIHGEPSVIELDGTGPDVERQERAHPHFVATGLGGHDALAVDLGSDVVWALNRQGEHWDVAPFASVHPGAGPRHAITVGDTMLVTGELSGNIATISLVEGAEKRVVAATGLDGDGPAYLGDVCLVAGRAAVAVRGRSSVSLFDLVEPTSPRLVQETVLPGSWPQQLHPVGDRVVVVDRDGGRLIDLDPATGQWTTLMSDLGKPMWLVELHVPSRG